MEKHTDSWTMGTVVIQFGTYPSYRTFLMWSTMQCMTEIVLSRKGERVNYQFTFPLEHISNLIPTVEPNPTDPTRPLNHPTDLKLRWKTSICLSQTWRISRDKVRYFFILNNLEGYSSPRKSFSPIDRHQVVSVTMKFHGLGKLKTWNFIVFWGGPFCSPGCESSDPTFGIHPESWHHWLKSSGYHPVLRIRDPVPFWQCCGPDPGSGIGCFFDPGFRDGRKSASGSGMNNPDHIF
jgi:hypothetical protein